MTGGGKEEVLPGIVSTLCTICSLHYALLSKHERLRHFYLNPETFLKSTDYAPWLLALGNIVQRVHLYLAVYIDNHISRKRSNGHFRVGYLVNNCFIYNDTSIIKN